MHIKYICFVIQHWDNTNYNIGMLCIDAFSTYCVIAFACTNEIALDLGVVECMHTNGGGALQIIMTDGEGCIKA